MVALSISKLGQFQLVFSPIDPWLVKVALRKRSRIVIGAPLIISQMAMGSLGPIDRTIVTNPVAPIRQGKSLIRMARFSFAPNIYNKSAMVHTNTTGHVCILAQLGQVKV